MATECLAVLLGRKLREVRSLSFTFTFTLHKNSAAFHIYMLFGCCMLLVGDAYWIADGGGIRGYSILLILQELMKTIGRIEKSYACEPSKADEPAESSYHPLKPLSPAPCTTTNNGDEPAKTESSPWLPCHYFDYVAGTSTGGYVQDAT